MESKKFRLSFKSIRASMLVSYSLLILFALLVFLLISLNYTERTVMQNSTEYTMQLVEQVNANIDSYIDYMDNISQLIVGNQDVRRYLFSDKDDVSVLSYSPSAEENDGLVRMYERVLEQFRTILDTRDDIVNIGIITTNKEKRYVFNKGDLLNENSDLSAIAYEETLLNQGEALLSSSHVQNVVKKTQYDWVVTLSRGMRSFKTNAFEGVFFIDLNYNVISDLCENNRLGTKGYIYIIDNEGGIVYHNRQQLLNKGVDTELVDEIADRSGNSFVHGKGRDSKLYTVSTSEKTGWSVVGVSYVAELMKNRDETQMLYIITASLLLVAAVIIAFVLSHQITRPLKTLSKSMHEVEKGNFEAAVVDIQSENEIGRLSRTFNIMAKRIQNLIEANVEEQRQKRKNELRALQSQINPHFLYNTLDSIIWMAEWGKNEEVVEMTSALSKLLRNSISNEEELVTIEQELEYIRVYLTIQRMRYKDKLEFSFDVDEDILDEKIIKLVLQPLVENAIYHGIKYNDGKGMICLSGSRLDDNIMIQISDDGIGMNGHTLSKIFEKHENSENSHGVGVYNVRNRLQLYYGNACSLNYESEYQKGTTVTIIIPAGEKGEEL